MSKQLPERADFGQLKKQAKDLLDGIRAGDQAALARAAIEKVNAVKSAAAADAFALHDAQRVIAREYGFASWAKLKLHVETRTLEAAETRLIEAALAGENAVVSAVLADRPALATRNLSVAAALGDERTVASELKRDAEAARRKGGPRDWEPILYLCFGRCGGGDRERVGAVHALLAGGADPNTSWIDEKYPDSPLSALYGATGVNNYPLVAQALISAGARTNDGESIYHAAQHNHRACLEVLARANADFSGRQNPWGNTPLYFLLGHAPHSPAAAVATEGIRWLLEHGADPNAISYVQKQGEAPLHAAVRGGWPLAMIELLLCHGADLNLRRKDGRTPLALALRAGAEEIAAFLQARGAQAEMSPADRLIAACMRGDETEARAVVAEHPMIVRELGEEDRPAPIEAARAGRARVLALMSRLGFDLTARGELGATALHWAAWHGWTEAVRALLDGGAPIDVQDATFHAPPLGWCDHGSLHCKNVAGDYIAVAEALLAAGAAGDGTEGSPAVKAAIERARK